MHLIYIILQKSFRFKWRWVISEILRLEILFCFCRLFCENFLDSKEIWYFSLWWQMSFSFKYRKKFSVTENLKSKKKRHFSKNHLHYFENALGLRIVLLHCGGSRAVVGLYFNVIKASAAPSLPLAHLRNSVKWRRRREELEAKLTSLHMACSLHRIVTISFWQVCQFSAECNQGRLEKDCTSMYNFFEINGIWGTVW